MELLFALILLITGLFVGIFSGLLGIGGAFIMTPVQYWIFTSMGFGSDTALLVAFGTSLFVVFPTALSSTLWHAKEGAVRWRDSFFLGISSAVAALLGVVVVVHLPSGVLKTIFGFVVILSGLRMLTAKTLQSADSPIGAVSVYRLLALGVPIGFFSGLLGIGGAIIAMPLMTIVLKFEMHEAVGTSAALLLFTSLVGAAAYAFSGLNISSVPPYSIGYVNLLSFALLAGTSIPMAQVGARIAHKVPGKQLKYVFVVLLMYIGLRMIGLFDLIGVPLLVWGSL